MRHFTKSLRSGIGLAVAVGLVVPSAGWGQATRGRRGGGPAGAVEIEEITVTAQKREENIQEIPISVTAITAEKLAEKGAVSLLDLSESVPNLHVVASTNGSGNLGMSLRGPFAVNGALAQNNTTGVYIDGVYLAKILGGNMDLEDLDRVEVLRGPQGTLFGRNTISGAINLVTKKPTEERAITLHAEAGNFDQFKGRVTLNVPLIGKNGYFRSDALGTLSLRENAVYRSNDGFYQNKSPTNLPASGGSVLSSTNRVFNMLSLRWEPTKDITVDYAFEYHRFRGTPTAFQDIAIVSPAGAALAPYVRPNKVDSIGNNIVLGPDAAHPPRRFSDDGNNRMHLLTAAWNLGEFGPLGQITLKSIAGYRSQFTEGDLDLDGSPLHITDFRRHGNVETWSEEAQVIGMAARLHYVLGAIYYGERTTQYDTTVLHTISGELDTIGYNRNWADSYASFGQATVTPPILNDKLSLTGGLRYTTEHAHTNRDFRCLGAFFVPGLPDFNLCNLGIPNLTDFHASLGRDFGGLDALTYTGSVDYSWTQDLMTYFRASKGWQSGYLNAEATDPSLLTFVDPEQLLTYEVGFKSQWFENRVRLNADGFYSDYTDQVINTFRSSATGGVQSTLQNAGKSRFYGAEVEAVAIPFRGLEIDASWAYLDARFKEFLEQVFDANGNPQWLNPCPPGGSSGVNCNTKPHLVNTAKNRPFVLAPEHTVTVGATYTAPPTSAGTFSAHLDTYWQNDFIIFTVPTAGGGASRLINGPAYAVVNGRLRFANIPLQQGSLDLEVFGRNLFDRKYRTFGIDFGDTLGWQGAIFGDPRTFGIGLTYRFTAS